MHLHRVTPRNWDMSEPYFCARSNDYRTAKSDYCVDATDWVVVANFPRCFGGHKNQFDFKVGITWEDVEKIIENFCEIGRPEAVALREAMKLAKAAKELGWREPEPVSPQSK